VFWIGEAKADDKAMKTGKIDHILKDLCVTTEQTVGSSYTFLIWRCDREGMISSLIPRLDRYRPPDTHAPLSLLTQAQCMKNPMAPHGCMETLHNMTQEYSLLA